MEEVVVLRNCHHYNNVFYFTIVLSLLRVRVCLVTHTHTPLLSSCFTSSVSDAFLDTGVRTNRDGLQDSRIWDRRNANIYQGGDIQTTLPIQTRNNFC